MTNQTEDSKQQQFALLEKHFRTFATETGGEFGTVRGISQAQLDFGLAAAPPFLRSLEKLQPIFDLLGKGGTPSEASYQEFLNTHVALRINYSYRSRTIVFKASNYGGPLLPAIQVAAAIKLTHKFCLSTRSRDFYSFLSDRPVIERRKPNTLTQWLVSPLISTIWDTLPYRTFRLRFNLPILNEILDANCSERAIGEDFLNDWRVRECLLNLENLEFSVGYPDLSVPDMAPIIQTTVQFDRNRKGQLNQMLTLIKLALDLFEGAGVITSEQATEGQHSDED